ncbi:hypothetical protein Lfu02_14660 [Longispora fulva]|uniref:DUF6545 domain-containing protein n=1 Tax=Longispora fulva TaxID=619741 RepID=A0A8J7KMI3_9ACTN|nr:MAB_1171c family putative transporter [Longispora fulva]MBG6140524.1 hypothetical protein [Longispora fulva]GIG57094.1 hypothetical protein Lfu02_14660 [Longispora fulva]
MKSVLFLFCAAVSWFAAIYTVRGVRTATNPAATKALAVGLAFLGAGLATSTPAVATPLNRALGVPNLMRPISHMCVIVFAASIGLMLTYWAHERAAARKRALLVVAFYTVLFITMGVFYALIGADVETSHWSERYAAAPWAAQYLMTFLTGFAAALGMIAWQSRRYAGFVQDVMLRRGLRMVAAGACLGLTYCLYKVAYVAAEVMGDGLPGPLARNEYITPAICAPGALLMIVGLTLPAWGPAIRCFRQYRTLYPLWRDLYAANPSILLAKTPYAARPARDLARLLDRLVIEIPDGMQRLTPYYAADVAEEIGTLHGIDRSSGQQALGTAMRVAAALHAHESGTAPERTADFPYGTGATGDEQLQWLLAIARHFRRHPVVRAYRSGSNTLGGVRANLESTLG